MSNQRLKLDAFLHYLLPLRTVSIVTAFFYSMKHIHTTQHTGMAITASEMSIAYANPAALATFASSMKVPNAPAGEEMDQPLKAGLILNQLGLAEMTQSFLAEHASVIELTSIFSTSEEACQFVEANHIKLDVMMIALHPSELSGIDHVRTVKNRMPKVQVLVLADYEDGDSLLKCLLAGASGYLLKDQMQEHLVQTVQHVVSGGSALNSYLAKKVVHFFQKRPNSGSVATTVAALSEREREVLEHLAKSLAYKEIAVSLGISVETVRRHCHNIYEKMQVTSRTQAVVKFMEKSSPAVLLG
jgi:DNA-binding NarL/FixJ family response regulator